MDKFILNLCFRSCLRGENDREYYEILGFESKKHATPEAIKKQFKKKSLELHPVIVSIQHTLNLKILLFFLWEWCVDSCRIN